MGQRANLVLVHDSGYSLFYCHWCANTLERAMFWGPEYAIPFVLEQRSVDDGAQWLDDVWAEGGVVLDRAQRVLLFYGGEDVLHDIPLRRLYLELLRENWQNWQVQWASSGIIDMVDYVHLPHEKVLARNGELYNVTVLQPPQELDWTDVVCSIIFEDDTLLLYPLAGDAEGFLRMGSTLVQVAQSSSGVPELQLGLWSKEFPVGGFHIDVPARQLLFWNASDITRVDEIVQNWPNWSVQWLEDRYESQLERTRGKLSLPPRPIRDLLVQLENILIDQQTASGRALFLKTIDGLQNEGHNVQINPYASRDDPHEVPLITQREIFDRAVAAWRQKRSEINN